MKTIFGMARLAVLAGALALTGCVTTENSLSANDIAAMKLTGVTVAYTPDAHIRWDDGIRAYAASKGIADDAMHPDQYAGRQGLHPEHAGAADQGRSGAADGRQLKARGRCGSTSWFTLHDCIGDAANSAGRQS